MKKTRQLLAGIAASICLLYSCSTKIQISAPYKNILVIYGLLDQGDTAHYIRIQKAFLDNSKTTLDMAKVSDSSYAPNLVVKMEKVTATGHIDSTFLLYPVDLNKEGYPKDSGTFFSNVNFAYKFKDTLFSNFTYRLVVTNTQTGDVDSAETQIIETNPRVFNVPMFGIANSTVDFTDTTNYSVYLLNFDAPGTAQMFSGVMHICWWDLNLSTQDSVLRSVDWNFASYVFPYTDSATIHDLSLSVFNHAFYTYMAQQLIPCPQGIVRHMAYNDIYIYTATDDYYQYITITNGQSGTLNSSQIHPTYTNIKGPNVVGLFTCRGMRAGYHHPFRPTTITAMEQTSVLVGANIKD